MNAIKRAIKVVGSQSALAEALGIKQPTVSEWVRGGRPLPLERCIDIERVTRALGKAVTCEELRPDIPWHVLRTPISSAAVAADCSPVTSEATHA